MHLNEGRGHVLNYQRSVKASIQRLGWFYKPILASSPVSDVFELDPDLIEINGGLIDKERHVILSELKKAKIHLFIWSAIKFGIQFKHSFNKIYREDVTNIVFIECFNPIQLFLIILGIIKPGKNIQLWMVIRGSINWGGGKHRLLAWFYGFGNYTIIKIFENFCELKILTDSSILKNNLQSFHGKPVYEIPLPHGYSKINKCNNRTSEHVLKLWAPGNVRLEKGQKTFEWLIENQFFSNQRIDLFISGLTQSTKSNTTKLNFSLIHLGRDLSEQDYYSMFAEVDFVLLPYDSRIYAESTSGVFVEAIAQNCMPVVTDGTWMASELSKYGLNSLIITFDEQLVQTLTKLRQDASIKEKILQMSRDYRRYHSVEGLAVEFMKIAYSS